MEGMKMTQWLHWARKLQAIAQIGLGYSQDVFDRERFEQILGISAEIYAHHTTTDKTHILDLFHQETWYMTPKIGVRAAIFRDNDGIPEILLVQELLDEGRWTIPGGFCDVGDTPSEAIIREVREETGFDVKVSKLIGIFDQSLLTVAKPPPFHLYRMIFLCEIVGGTAQTSIETGQCAYFPQHAIPELSERRTHPTRIATLFDHFCNPALPTQFD